jgi:hypothetical protein
VAVAAVVVVLALGVVEVLEGAVVRVVAVEA